ncbi:hypothetical protein [Agromyces mariniharenae]|uniref:Uncharacterized protein n=1 Tax=Agromyces mariniharenae TaxID=2604423 RepID=A0A5S4V7C2_9MICO|nr:hypothetical protein [Agromyces mariniharenae]TYL54008.1 hypothetical protein FYC51_10435 [Agromyces mariniharenae]
MGNRAPKGLIPAIVLALITLALVLARVFGLGGEEWRGILEAAPVYVGAAAAAFIVIAVYNWWADARDRRLARDHPGALVFGAEMTAALKRRLRSDPDQYTAPAVTGRTPHLFTVVSDAEGLSMWNGSASKPVRFWWIDWHTVSGIRAAMYQLQYKEVRGLVLDTSTGAVLGALELVPRSTRLLSARNDRSPALIERLTELWRAARQARPNT